MYIFAYLRASTREQDAERAKNRLQQFVTERGHRIASWYIENVSGASLQRPVLMRLLENSAPDLLPVFSHRQLLVTSAFGSKQTLRLTASGNFWMPRQRHGGAR